ncbi:Na+/H+ antiporter NhaC family protein (plasmid) [Methanosphaera sp. ISO3-F5]|uniref:Na+/H+ antiporter NhaC family protein n=1 Tax=Methanosphaera sp. ISO3-F5 TaxID=1452353 RepID=UPI002B262DDE|nr:Na+/H+ antiporter NhaC family protein [Methanosphaera sp. ISO3-F5]WQH65370.1 Na+/H+ antiporter NhaC family protein [Methanosphaera sp. ISO3-F5]
MNTNTKIGVMALLSIILLFVLSFWITLLPQNTDNSLRFGILTLLPPLVAIILAFVTKQTLLSLFLGVFVGEFMLNVRDVNVITTAVNAFLQLCGEVITSMSDPWNAAIILQCLLIGGIIQLITRMGGTKALGDAFARRADTPEKAQLLTWALGMCVFFDDYANALIVGPIMRSVTDKLKISREKLSFIIDSTAAPVAGISIISTWIGLEITLIKDALNTIGLAGVSGFGLFLETIPFRFYNIFILIFVVLSALTLYEFGPMKKAEQDARKRKNTEKVAGNSSQFKDVQPVENIEYSVWSALIPILTLVITALLAFYWSGYNTILTGNNTELIHLMNTSPFSFNGIFEALSNSDASVALFQSALFASIVAILISVGKNILTIGEALDEWVNGMKPILLTGVILLLAWSLGGVVDKVGTAHYLISVLESSLPMFILPTLIFVLSAIISFATGTAYGTMSILMPLAIPLAWAIGGGDMNYLIVSISGVLTGSIFGDHCSPISDTTILSAMGSGCDHISHVGTQIYYAVFVALVAIVVGYIPAGFGVQWYLSIPVGIVVLYAGLRFLGERVGFDGES